jgi:hypothetical protein
VSRFLSCIFKNQFFCPVGILNQIVSAGKLFVLDFPIHPGSLQSLYKSGDFQIPITLSKIKYGTRSKVHFEALEQTLCLRLVSGPADK